MFDGVCNFCNGSVNFVIKRDKKNIFTFAALQSEAGKKILGQYGVISNMDTFIFLENGRIYQKSTAALRVLRYLKFYNLLYPLIFIPTFLRDFIYSFIARNRYKWFGKKDVCMIPDESIKSKFLN